MGEHRDEPARRFTTWDVTAGAVAAVITAVSSVLLAQGHVLLGALGLTATVEGVAIVALADAVALLRGQNARLRKSRTGSEERGTSK